MREAGLTADEAISHYKKATVRRVFPGQFINSRLEEIEAAALGGDRAAQTSLKLLFDKRFDK